MGFEEKVLGYLAELHQKTNDINHSLTGLETRITSLEGKVTNLEARMMNMETSLADVKTTVIRIEKDHGKKLDALSDGYKQNTQAIFELNTEIKILGQKVEEHEVKLKVVR